MHGRVRPTCHERVMDPTTHVVTGRDARVHLCGHSAMRHHGQLHHTDVEDHLYEAVFSYITTVFSSILRLFEDHLSQNRGRIFILQYSVPLSQKRGRIFIQKYSVPYSEAVFHTTVFSSILWMFEDHISQNRGRIFILQYSVSLYGYSVPLSQN